MEWAQSLRIQLKADIQTLRARAREGPGSSEELGLLPDGDRLSDLHSRLAQVERLIGALEETAHETEAGWPPNLDAPSEKNDAPLHRR